LVFEKDAKNKVVEDVVVLSGDHLYRMDYMDFVQVTHPLSSLRPGSFTELIRVRSFGWQPSWWQVFRMLATDYVVFVWGLLQKHRDSGADITISCVPMDDRYILHLPLIWILG
jgi:ADP-glucose pyrophosphorylase